MGLMKLLKVVRKHLLKEVSIDYSTDYYDNLNLLIIRAKNRMKHDTLYCPFCNHELQFRMSKLQGGGMGQSPVGSPIHDDQLWKCPNCFYAARFGIPMTKEEAINELKVRKGIYLCVPLLRKDETTRQDIRKRLKALGYIDFDIEEERK